MRKLTVYNFLTLNGFFKGVNEDISWHKHGQEEGEYAAQSAGAANILLFGRVTYEMMAGFWPTPMAMEMNPSLATEMNRSEKIVFSNSLVKADWNNTRVISGNIIEEIRKLKLTPGPDMTILGSGSIVTQFADAGLIDAYQFMIDPVAIGQGTPVFEGLQQRLELRLTSSRIFRSGIVLLDYEPLTP